MKLIKNIYIHICILGRKKEFERTGEDNILLSDNTLLTENINVSHRINPNDSLTKVAPEAPKTT